MECCGRIVKKFIKFLTVADRESDELKLPIEIASQCGYRLETGFALNFRNGYRIPMAFNAEKGTIFGLSTFYDDFDLVGGEMLLFEFSGVSDFNVYVIGTDLTEIDYPNVFHYMQSKRPRVVSVRNGGLKFVNFVTEDNPVSDELKAPQSFKNAIHLIPGYQSYTFSNGKKIVGGYKHELGRFHGLKNFCSILGIENFRNYNLLLLSYEECGSNKISVFDDNFVEVLFPGTPLSPGLNSHNPSVDRRIEITIQPCHMYKYAYGVDISTDYERVTSFWRQTDYINVYFGENAWTLQVKRRGCKCHRTAIKDGWMEFRDDIGLGLGDVLVLECADYCVHHFAVRVMKSGDA